MELINKTKSHKKPAMALVLIIIIITSLTVVIMGTLKLITASSGNYSIDRNAKGVMNLKKQLGRYICFKYGGNLYQARVLYNSDGTIYSAEPPEKLSPSANCVFDLLTGINHYQITLIGGGSGGSQSSYGSLIYRINPEGVISSVTPFFEEDKTDYASFKKDRYQVDLQWMVKNKPCVFAASSLDPNINLDQFIKDDKKCWWNIPNDETACTCSYSTTPIPSGAGGLVSGARLYSVKLKDTEKGAVMLNVDIEDAGDIKSLYTLLGKKIDVNHKICNYEPYITYRSSMAAPPGNVVPFTVARSELADKTSFKICRAPGSGCNAYVGDGGAINSQGGETYFKYDYLDSNGATKSKEFTTDKTDSIQPTSQEFKYNGFSITDSLISESGKEADYVFSEDFNFGLNLYTGYVFKNESGNMTVKKSTLFGSSGAILSPTTNPKCDDGSSKIYRTGVYAETETGCPKSNDSVSCDDGTIPEFAPMLQGAPGAIVIEW